MKNELHSISAKKNSWQIVDNVLCLEKHLSLLDGVLDYPEIPLVITGETGTGKEELAKIFLKKRRQQNPAIPFVAVNCAHLNIDLATSLLFGHRKGAFSGALETTNGYIGDAHNGILFLDEIQSLSTKTQQKMLRVLNDGSYSRMGDTKELKSHFQLIIATTRDLDQEVDEGRLLLDLRHRISGIEIPLRPLRERLEDVPTLIQLAFAKHGLVCSPGHLMRFSLYCSELPWPGNIRQLFRALDLCIIKAKIEKRDVSLDDLPKVKFRTSDSVNEDSPLPPFAQDALALLTRSFESDLSLDEVLNTVEKSIIMAACQRHQTFSAVQKALGIGKTTLEMKRKKFQI